MAVRAAPKILGLDISTKGCSWAIREMVDEEEICWRRTGTFDFDYHELLERRMTPKETREGAEVKPLAPMVRETLRDVEYSGGENVIWVVMEWASGKQQRSTQRINHIAGMYRMAAATRWPQAEISMLRNWRGVMGIPARNTASIPDEMVDTIIRVKGYEDSQHLLDVFRKFPKPSVCAAAEIHGWEFEAQDEADAACILEAAIKYREGEIL